VARTIAHGARDGWRSRPAQLSRARPSSSGEATHIGDASAGATGSGRSSCAGNVGARSARSCGRTRTGDGRAGALGSGRRTSARNGRASTIRPGHRAGARHGRAGTLRPGRRACTRNGRASTIRPGNGLSARNCGARTFGPSRRAGAGNFRADGAIGVEAAWRGVCRGERRHRDGRDRGTGEQNRLQGDLQIVRFECHATWTTHTHGSLKLWPTPIAERITNVQVTALEGSRKSRLRRPTGAALETECLLVCKTLRGVRGVRS
jgi:hypothetical protein